MSKYHDIVISLAGVCQSATLVTQLADSATCNHEQYKIAVKSLFNTSPSSVDDVFGGIANIEPGLRILIKVLNGNENKTQMDLMRYIFGSLGIANKLRKNDQALTELSQRLSRIAHLHAPVSEEIIAEHIDELSYSLAGIYADIISPITTKIKVTGKIECLQNTLVQAKIRTALFACVRAGTLWFQMGGSRWQFIFSRKKMLQAANELLSYS